MDPDSFGTRIKSMYVNYERLEKRVEERVEEGGGERRQRRGWRKGEKWKGVKRKRRGRAITQGGVCQRT